MRAARSATASTIPASTLDALNWMRGLAALAVLIGHVRRACFVDWGGRHSALTRAVYFATNFSHQAVIVFFVLSGFLVGTSVVEASRRGTWSWARYAMRRVTRLYVVLVPVLLLTLAWDTLGLSLFGVHGIYGGKGPGRYLGVPDVRTTLTLPVLFANLAFLQDIFTRAFGTNTPLWTLALEFWSYALFPLLFRAAAGNERRLVRVLFATASGAILTLGGELLRLCFAVWALGAVVVVMRAKRPALLRNHRGAVVATALFVAGALVSRSRLLHSRSAEDLVLGAVTALFLAMLVARGETLDASAGPSRPSRYSRWGDRLASFSYTLYATQFPVVVFAEAWLVGRRRWLPDHRHAAAATLIGLGVLVYAYGIAWLTEFRTAAVRRWLDRRGRAP